MSTYPGSDIERGIFILGSAPSSLIYLPYFVDGHRDWPPLGREQSLLGGSDVRDGSVTIFTMYSKIVEEEGNKMARGWRKDADRILIFVGSHVNLRAS